MAVGQLVQILALGKEVRGFLRLRLCDAADVPHFRHQEQVLEIVALVDEQSVDA